jgi:ubiquinone/menaquinone biosynthesis C-methylase UbiE
MIARRLYYFLSPKMRRVARRLVYFPIDVLEQLTGKRHPLTPPRGMIFTGSGDFIQSGKQLMELCINQASLTPNSHILDVGCGIGRLAVPLTSFLSKQGSYNGFDIVADGINWCTKNIASNYSNFTFKHIPLRNDLYNLATKSQAKQFVFPYNDNAFDLVVLTSVFTHMQYQEVQNYLKQINRVLKPGGKCLATFFVIDEATKQIIENDPKVMQFDYEYDTYYLHDANVKDANIAFKYDALMSLLQTANLNLVTFNKGWWRGTNKTNSFNFQDVVVVEKPR